MRAMEIDLTDPDPVHEAAYKKVLTIINDHRRHVDAWVAAGPARMAGNFLLAAVKLKPDFVRLRALWGSDAEFRGYLKEKLAFQFGADYTKRLIAVFLN